MGVHRLLGPAHGPIGLAQRLEHDRVVGLELERAVELLLDELGGRLAHRTVVAMLALRHGGAPLSVGPGMARIDGERLGEARDRLVELTCAALRQAEIVLIVRPLRRELNGGGELLGGFVPLLLVEI